MKLIISIPTYNRPERLRRVVTALIPQIEENCRIEIFDNASERGMDPHVLDLQEKFPERLVINHNVANIGMGANLTRCVELAEADWVWVLGDDDIPRDDAIATIFQTIHERGNGACLINFASEWSGERVKTVCCGSVAELCANNSSLQNLLFISTSLFHRERFLEHLRFAYGYNHSLGGFLAPPLMELARGSSIVVLESAQIVQWQKADHGGSWTMLAPTLGLMTLLELPLGLDDRQFSALGKLLASHTLNPRATLRATLLDTPNQSASYKKYLFRQIRARIENRRWTSFPDRFWWGIAVGFSHFPIGINLWLLSRWLGRDRVRELQGSLFKRI